MVTIEARDGSWGEYGCPLPHSRPIVRHYACPICHSSLTAAQSEKMEYRQKRALNIIFPGGEYVTKLINANVETLSTTASLSQNLFRCALRNY